MGGKCYWFEHHFKKAYFNSNTFLFHAFCIFSSKWLPMVTRAIIIVHAFLVCNTLHQ